MRPWMVAAGLVLVIPAAFSAWTLAASDGEDPSAVLGVRLGMTSGQVRERYIGDGGRWQTAVEPSGLTVLEHDSETGPVAHARFEIHEGLLVAVRATLRDRDALADDARFVSGPGLVRRVENLPGGGADLVLIARSCPLHSAEVDEILASR